MKSSPALSCLAALALLLTPGCAPRYKITLTNNHVVTSHGKPKWDKKQGTVSFTDAEGRKQVVPWINVRSWEPQ